MMLDSIAHLSLALSRHPYRPPDTFALYPNEIVSSGQQKQGQSPAGDCPCYIYCLIYKLNRR
jgi:hypothetical protein